METGPELLFETRSQQRTPGQRRHRVGVEAPNGGSRARTFLDALQKSAENCKSNKLTSVNAHVAFCFGSELRFEKR